VGWSDFPYIHCQIGSGKLLRQRHRENNFFILTHDAGGITEPDRKVARHIETLQD
jgi:hypothetical protein